MARYSDLTHSLRFQHVVQLISTLQPQYFKSIRGVPMEDILSLERTLPAPFPRAYKEFLSLMGADKNFNAFGRSQHDFQYLSARHPTIHYPSYLFCIAHDADNDLDSPIDLFIDLRLSQIYDPPLFEYEAYNHFRPESVVCLKLSFMEFITRQVLIRFIDFPSSQVCYYPFDLIEYLDKKGYASSIPLSPNLRYLTKLDNHIMIEILEENESYTSSSVSFCGDVNDVKEELDGLMKKFYASDI